MEYTAYYVAPMLYPFSQTRYYFYNETSKYGFYMGLIAPCLLTSNFTSQLVLGKSILFSEIFGIGDMGLNLVSNFCIY